MSVDTSLLEDKRMPTTTKQMGTPNMWLPFTNPSILQTYRHGMTHTLRTYRHGMTHTLQTYRHGMTHTLQTYRHGMTHTLQTYRHGMTHTLQTYRHGMTHTLQTYRHGMTHTFSFRLEPFLTAANNSKTTCFDIIMPIKPISL